MAFYYGGGTSLGIGFWEKPPEGFGLPVQQVQAIGRAYPEPPVAVFQDGFDVVVRNGSGIERVVLKHLETVSVKTVQPVFCACPEETLTVLKKCGDEVLRKPQLVRDALEFDLLGIANGAVQAPQKGQQEEGGV